MQFKMAVRYGTEGRPNPFQGDFRIPSQLCLEREGDLRPGIGRIDAGKLKTHRVHAPTESGAHGMVCERQAALAQFKTLTTDDRGIVREMNFQTAHEQRRIKVAIESRHL